jgi:exodeoxyribonuclease V alpha subunit
MDAISGTIESISKPYNGGWRFAAVPPHGVVVGNLPDNLRTGDVCLFKGKWKTHQKYGKQFQAEEVHVEIPKDVQGVRQYLGRHFKWIGPTVAIGLIKEFGERLFSVMEHSPEKLTKIHGITAGRALEIQAEYLKIKYDREIDVWFATHGITLGMRNKLVDRYGSKSAAVDAIKSNPYALADEVWGVGFKKADAIALSFGINRDSTQRMGAGVRWVLHESSNGEGHSFLPAEELLTRCRDVLGVGDEPVKVAINAGIQTGKLTAVAGAVYHTDLYMAEKAVTEKLAALAGAHHEIMMSELDPAQISEMDPDQQRAVQAALSSRMSIITGGPGTGKTFVVKRIMAALGERDIMLAAPTGKAAKRMQELTGREALTIHRLLEFNPFDNAFLRDHNNPLECETLIVDEASMIDIRLMASLMDAVTAKTQVIFVGDVDQLPSVGPGRVLADMIDSEIIPTSRLRTLHRQAAASLININAQRINAGKKLELNNASGDFWYWEVEQAEEIPDRIIQCINAIPGKFGFALEDIQVLCPQKRGVIGTRELNQKLGPVLNPKGAKLSGIPYRIGDRVIQTRNNYKLEIFNGDIGTVLDATSSHILIRFDFDVDYPMEDLSDLQPAYALTIHKSQGSEFPVVIIPVHTTNYMMLKRNLLYTAITRGKSLVVLIGSMKAVNLAIRSVESSMRFSNLKGLLAG